MIKIQDDGIFLDFMAGSGTSGESILNFNLKENTSYKFILCTNNENGICTDVCYPRLKKVITGYKFTGKNKQVLFEEKLTASKLFKSDKIMESIKQIKLDKQKEFDKFETKLENDNTFKLYGIKEIADKKEGLGGSLKYFKTDFVDSEPTDQNKKIMVEESTEMLCLKEDCFGLVTEGDQFQIFKNRDGRYLGIIYYYDGIEPYKKEVKRLGKKINTYVFSLTDYVDSDEFEDIQSLITLKPVPSAILNVYRRIFAYVQTEKLPGKARK